MWFSTLLALILILIILWLWQSNLRAKELAFKTAKALCDLHQVELLDDTVSLKEFKLKRLPDGQMAFWRVYQFDYSQPGQEAHIKRYRGKIIIHGHEILHQSLKFQEGASVLNRVTDLAPDFSHYPSNTHSKILNFKNLNQPANDDHTNSKQP